MKKTVPKLHYKTEDTTISKKFFKEKSFQPLICWESAFINDLQYKHKSSAVWSNVKGLIDKRKVIKARRIFTRFSSSKMIIRVN